MKKKDWEKYFPSTILSRGLDYYKAGLVYDIEFNEDNNELRATVSGTEEYSVSICFGDSRENISEMYCDCPYAESGYNCKHMAALLYAFDDGLKTEPLKSTVKMKSVSIESIIDCEVRPEDGVTFNFLLTFNFFCPKTIFQLVFFDI